jgi:hypothetical protein
MEHPSLQDLVCTGDSSSTRNASALADNIKRISKTNEIGMTDHLFRSHHREGIVVWIFLAFGLCFSFFGGFLILFKEGISIANLLMSYGLLFFFICISYLFYRDDIDERNLASFIRGMIYIRLKRAREQSTEIVNSLLKELNLEFSTDIYTAIPGRVRKFMHRIYFVTNPNIFIIIYKVPGFSLDEDTTLVLLGPVDMHNWDLIERIINKSRMFTRNGN